MAIATVIGGAGRMGAWFASFLKKNGYRIIICDKNTRVARNLARKKRFLFIENLRLAVQPAQLVILATPTHITKRILEDVEPHLSRRCLLVEISSVKAPIQRILQDMKKRGTTVLSIHPMFGPGVKNIAGKTIVTALFPHSRSAANKFLSLFRREGAKIIESDLDQQDMFASLTLALPHFMNIVMVDTLKSYGVGPNQLQAVAGTTFKLQLLIAEAIYRESFSNESSILMGSKRSLKALKTFVKLGDRTLSKLSEEARGTLIQELKKGRSYLRRDATFPSVYGNFNAAVEASTHG